MKKKIYRIKNLALAKSSDSPFENAGNPVNDDTYRQINQKSFKQNFKMLIGHYQSFQSQTVVGK